MTVSFRNFDALVARVQALPVGRRLIGIAGPPGSGKSTLSEALAAALNAEEAGMAAVIPMDGFHLDDQVLAERHLLARKGAPQTFDVAGFRHLLLRLRDDSEPEIAVPVFDRSLEISRAGARMIPASVRILLVEGNYLLLQDAPWRDLAPAFDLTVMVREPRERLEARLIARWQSFGFDEEKSRAKVTQNDLPNVDLVLGNSSAADFETSETRTPV